MNFAIAFFVIFCALLLISSSNCQSREFTNIIPISRRSLLRRRALAGDFDAVFAVSRVLSTSAPLQIQECFVA